MKKFVWDSSAILNIKESDESGYSPGYSLFKDLSDGWITGSYENIFPTLAVFEVSAAVSRKHREGQQILREFYILDDHSRLYDVNEELVHRSTEIVAQDGFSKLRGADLVFACIAYLEKAYLVTKDNHFTEISVFVNVINLNDSLEGPNYRRQFKE